MAGEGLFKSKKWVIVALRFLLLASLLVIFKFQGIKTLPSWLIWITIWVLFSTNILLIAMPRHRFKSQMLYGGVFISDLVIVTILMIAVAGNKVEFYAVFIPYIATIVYTAMTRRLSSAFLIVVMAALVYGAFVLLSGSGAELLSTPFLTWVVLFFLTAFFVGYLAEEIKREIELEEKLEESEKTADEAKHELVALRSLHELIAESIPAGLVVFNKDFVVEYANPQFAAIIGAPQSEIEGREVGFLPCSYSSNQEHLRSLLEEAVKTKAAKGPDDFTCKTPAGEDMTVLCNIYPIASDDDALRMVAVLEDVTRKKMNEAGRLEKMRIESQLKILSSLSGAMSSLGSLRQIISRFASATETLFSFTACATLELDRKPLTMDIHLTAKVGQKFVDQLRERLMLSVTQLVPEADDLRDSPVLEINEQLLEEGLDLAMGSFLAVPVVVANVTHALIGFASTGEKAFKPQDISFAYTLANYYSLILSRAHMEEDLLRREVEDQMKEERLKLEAAKRQAEIEATRKSLETEKMAVRELKRLDELKSEFISTVSHEMRTPMTSIKSSMDLLLSGRLGEVQKEHKPFLEIAVRNINRLAQLIDDVLNVSRIESGKVKMTPGIYEVRPIFDGVLGTLDTKLKESSVTVDMDIPESLTARFDRNCLTQVLTNLAGNAVNHNEPGMNLTICSVVGEEGYLTLSVSDDGIGIRESEREKIFDRFFQSGRTYGEGSKGTGLGLTISRGLVEAMGGRLWVEPRDEEFRAGPQAKGPGAEFRVSLPLTEEIFAGAKREDGEPDESDLDSALLFGKIAVLMKYVTQEQVSECVREQGEDKSPRKLGELLIEKKYMTSQQRDLALEVQQANLSRPSSHDPDKTLADVILGRLAVSEGLLSEEKLNEALREQANMAENGRHILLGELLVKKGFLSISQILSLLSRQDGDDGQDSGEEA